MSLQKGRCLLHVVSGSVNKEQYIQVPDSCPCLKMKDRFSQNVGIFVQDEVPCSTVEGVMNNF